MKTLSPLHAMVLGLVMIDAEQARAGECPVHKYDEEMVLSMIDCPICGNRPPKEDDPREEDRKRNIKNYTVR